LFKDRDTWSGSPESISYRPGKGPFIALLALSAVATAGAGIFLWVVPTIGLGNIHPWLPYVFGAVLLGGALFVLLSAAFIALAAFKGSFVFYSPWFHTLLVKLFLPMMVMAGGLLRIERIKIERAFIDLNNQMVLKMGRRFRPEKLLILMPHCIQYDECKIKVTRNVRNCAGCGRCEVGDLRAISEEYGVDLFISTGGTVARRKVYEKRPDAVIAVACERDLTSGLQDAYPLPVYAIVNERPHGYCMETGVSIDAVRAALATMMEGPTAAASG